MPRKFCLYVLFALYALTLIIPVSANSDQLSEPVFGWWVLDKVYENASGSDRFVLDPESSASVYAENNNAFFIFVDGLASVSMNINTVDEWGGYGYWEKDGNTYRIIIDHTQYPYSETGEILEPDIDSAYIYEYNYDSEQDVFHRYWKDDNPDAMYHDLDFTYTRIPMHFWRMTKVYERGLGEEPVLLNPDTSASLYAESVNIYNFDMSHVSVNLSPEEYPFNNNYEYGTLQRDGDLYTLKFDDGTEMNFTYDAREHVLHRYWVETTADSTYHDLDFVYEQLPIWSWKLKYIFSLEPGKEPVLLDPEAEPLLYHERLYSYYFTINGDAFASIPQVVEDRGKWTMTNDEVLLSYDDGTEMHFLFDSKNYVLHRYKVDDSSDAKYPLLDLVYLIS